MATVAYTDVNFKTKKALKDAVAAGREMDLDGILVENGVLWIVSAYLIPNPATVRRGN